MKKLLFILFVTAAIFTGCQKDSSTVVNIKPNDLVAINAQLKGTWLYPVETVKYVDSLGRAVLPGQGQPAPALQFDGKSGVNMLPDLHTIQKGTYTLSSTQGLIYLTINYPNSFTVKYQVLVLDNQSLKLTSTQPYTYYDNSGNPHNASAIASNILSRQNVADATGGIIKVIAGSDSTYNISVYVNHKSTTDTSALLSSKSNITGNYNYQFPAKPGDQLVVTMLGNASVTYFFAFYNGLPLSGSVNVQGNQIQTAAGWQVQ